MSAINIVFLVVAGLMLLVAVVRLAYLIGYERREAEEWMRNRRMK